MLCFLAHRSKEDSVIVIEDSQDDDVIYVATERKEVKPQNDSSYFADASGSSTSSISFGTPPDRTKYLQLLYSGQGHLISDESLRVDARDFTADDSSNQLNQRAPITSTPKKNN